MSRTITTQHGRIITTPNVKGTRQGIVKLDTWLLTETMLEAEHAKDDYVAGMFSKTNPKKLSQADRDIMNVYLFGQEEISL